VSEPVPRVLHIASGDLWAGAEVQVCNLLFELRRRGDLALGALLLNDGELAARLRAGGIPVWIAPEGDLGFFALAAQVIARVRQFEATVIHSHRMKENLLASVAALACRHAVAMRTVHGITEYPAPWYRPDRRILRWLDRFSADRIHRRVVVVSRELQERGTMGVPPRVVYISNGVDVEQTRADAARQAGVPRSPGTRTICFAGRLVPVKRVDLLIETAAVLENRHPGDYHFLIAGDGPLMDSLKALAIARGLERVCEFLGFRPDVLSIISRADVLVLTSDHEGMPMVVLEALALGVPVVSHAVGGVVDIIREPRLGRLVADQDPESYADAIEGLRRTVTEQPPVLLPEEYSARSSASHYVKLYREIGSHNRV
jgi:glycosyltransferase involved in cell wall biosynthesis